MSNYRIARVRINDHDEDEVRAYTDFEIVTNGIVVPVPGTQRIFFIPWSRVTYLDLPKGTELP